MRNGLRAEGCLSSQTHCMLHGGPVGGRCGVSGKINTAPSFRDSGPYLHDGRARRLEQAAAVHGGQAEGSSRQFFALKPLERLQVESFLNTLAAPPKSR